MFSLPESAIITTLLLPLLATVLTLAFPRKYAEGIAGLAAVGTFGSALLLLAPVRALNEPTVSLLSLVPGLSIAFRADSLGLTFALLASGLWILATLFSYGYVRDNEMKCCKRYFASFAASITAAVGIALSANLLTFLLFYELLTLATYPLVVHKESQEAFIAGRRYLLYALSGGLLVTLGTIWLWNEFGTLDFVAGGFVHGLASTDRSALFLLLVLGCGVKAAIMPMHAWLPSAMVAPSPVSALLHAVAVVKAGVFGCIRMTGYVFAPEDIQGSMVQLFFITLTLVTIVVGSFLALRQENLKRRLAYSTVVHLSYIVLGACLLSETAYTGAILHMVNHGLAKITLFFCAGAIYATTHYTEVQQLRGIGKRMPWTMTAFTIASLGLIGVPGFCGFIGKLTLAQGALEAQHPLAAAIMLGASLFTAAYLLPIVRLAFFEQAEDDSSHSPGDTARQHPFADQARLSLVVPLMATALLVVVFGILPYAINLQYDLAASAAASAFQPLR